MTDRKWTRVRLGEMAVEAVMVVFAVLVALGVEEWREEAQLRDFADRARAAVIAEVQANYDEFESTGEGLAASVAIIGQTLREQDMDVLGGNMGLELPEFSSAAWRAAQASQAAPYLDYDWVIQVGRTYETYEIYARISDQLIEAYGGVIGKPPTFDLLDSIFGRLVILNEVHGQVQASLQAILDAEAAGS